TTMMVQKPCRWLKPCPNGMGLMIVVTVTLTNTWAPLLNDDELVVEPPPLVVVKVPPELPPPPVENGKLLPPAPGKPKGVLLLNRNTGPKKLKLFCTGGPKLKANSGLKKSKPLGASNKNGEADDWVNSQSSSWSTASAAATAARFLRPSATCCVI